MGNGELSPAARNLAKWCSVLSIVSIIYPLIFLVPDAGYPLDPISGAAQVTTHTHLVGNTLLLFMVGFFFSFTSYGRAKKIWPAIGAITLLIAILALLFGLMPLIIVGYSLYAISMLVMAVGILAKT